MRLKNRFAVTAFPLIVMVSGCGHAQSSRDLEPLPPTSSFPVASDVPQGFASSDQAAYDDVGYANVDLSEDGGAVPDVNAETNPLAITAGHKSLPIPSYAEVTNLNTGRTILVRINNKRVGSGRLIELSLGAARQLGVETSSRIPVRVRRTNPPEFERATLRQGQAAGERIETPPALLSALRKKLGVAPVDTVAALPTVATRAMAKRKPARKVGADFDAPRVAPSAVRGDRFIVEDGVIDRRVPSSREPTSDAAAFFVQIAAFSNESRARSLARQLGGSVVNAGGIWRVRKGPYRNQEQAEASLGVMMSKGYRDARITR